VAGLWPKKAEDIADSALLESIQNGQFHPGSLTHREHLRLGWAAIRSTGLMGAVDDVRDAVRAFASSQDCSEIYHETLTLGFLYILDSRIKNFGAKSSFELFYAHHPDLRDWRKLFRRHWSDELLWSSRARANWVTPDLFSIR